MGVRTAVRESGLALLRRLRRHRRVLGGLVAFALAAIVVNAIGVYWMERAVVPIAPEHRQGRLLSRPAPPTSPRPGSGHSLLGLARFRDCVVYVPASLPADRPAPLLLWLHGHGGGHPRLFDELVRESERAGAIVLAPQSRRVTWDSIKDKRFGRDVSLIDAALRWVFARFAVDPSRITIGGNSDGASYALTLGLINGDLFHRVVAFAPGHIGPGTHTGSPSIYIAHGLDDRTHPIDQTSRPIAAEIRAQGYAVTYQEFDAGHDVIRQAMTRGLADL